MDDKLDIVTLLDRFQKLFPAEWREDRWYLTAVRKSTHEAYIPIPPLLRNLYRSAPSLVAAKPLMSGTCTPTSSPNQPTPPHPSAST